MGIKLLTWQPESQFPTQFPSSCLAASDAHKLTLNAIANLFTK